MKKKRLKPKSKKEEDKKCVAEKPAPAKLIKVEMSSPVCFANSPELRDEFKEQM